MAQELELEYRLADLPNPFYRAGLAGLILLLEAMDRRGRGRPVRDLQMNGQGARLRVSREDFQILFDELYDAVWVESKEVEEMGEGSDEDESQEETGDVNTRRPNRGPKKLRCQPRATFLEDLQCPQKGIDLWRRGMLTVVRHRPKQRSPYCERAAGAHVGRTAAEAWDKLFHGQRGRNPNHEVVVELSSSLLPDVQEYNAERIRFSAAAHLAFLLHFWPVATTFWLPIRVRWVPTDKRHVREYPGYVLAVPDVRVLDTFVAQYPAALQRLEHEGAEIAVPEESALRFGCIVLAQAGAQSLQRARLRRFVDGFDVWHMERVGNNVHLRSRRYMRWDETVIDAYGRARFRHPLFQGCMVHSLLNGSPWYRPFVHPLSALPLEQFIDGPEADHWTRSFVQDAGRRFFEIRSDYVAEVGPVSSDSTVETPSRGRPLEVLIRDLLWSYVVRRMEQRTGLTWDTFKEGKAAPDKLHDYRERFQKLCQDVYLAVRGRRHRDAFVSYFAETLGSVPQFLPEADMLALSTALRGDSWSDVRALVMLAAAAISGAPRESQKESAGAEAQ